MRGHCLCGAVTFEVDLPVQSCVNCHYWLQGFLASQHDNAGNPITLEPLDRQLPASLKTQRLPPRRRFTSRQAPLHTGPSRS